MNAFPLDKLLELICITICVVSIIEAPVYISAKSTNPVIDDIVDLKDLKKLFRTKNNVLVCYISSAKKNANVLKVFREAADSIKGEGTMVLIDCSGEAKKLCRKMKITPDTSQLKHYKDGEFHKDYDRKITVASMLNFMRDPTGDIPWEEDDSASDVIHLPDAMALVKLIRRQQLPTLIMFYAPWCGFCKQLKPEYAAAASELKNLAVLAAIDVNRPENAIVRSQFNITGFPTMHYYRNGVKKFTYEGENKKDSLVSWMKDPTATPPKPEEEVWAEGNNAVIHLTDSSFDETLAETDSALVMFYAPWCGHCKRMKPGYERAADKMKTDNIPGILAALDATRESQTAKKWGVKGYPTIKYFQNGEFKFDVSVREEDKILSFMRDPKEPPPPPPPEAAWADQPSEVIHLGVEDFKPSLKKKKHALVMFYAPWCGHCKKAKPEYTAAAERLRDDPRVALAAVDCTVHSSVCSAHQVTGYPTIKLFNYLNKQPVRDYSGGRTTADFLRFMAPYTTVNLSDIEESPSRPSGDDWKPANIPLLNENNVNDVIAREDSILIMFYAPWCGHCTKLKPAYTEAADMLKESGSTGKLAAIDASAYPGVSEKYGITGFPTLKYFRKGTFITQYTGERTAKALVTFMKNPPTDPVKISKDEL